MSDGVVFSEPLLMRYWRRWTATCGAPDPLPWAPSSCPCRPGRGRGEEEEEEEEEGRALAAAASSFAPSCIASSLEDASTHWGVLPTRSALLGVGGVGLRILCSKKF